MSEGGNVGAGDGTAESEGAADAQAEAAVGSTQWQTDPTAESQAAADANTEAAVSRTQFQDDPTAMSQSAADAQVRSAVARTQWENAGLADESSMSTTVTAGLSQAGIGFNTNTGISVFFTVTLDVVDLGYWTKISGLGMSISTTDRGDSAMSFFQHHLPGHLTYDKITLERPVSPSSVNIMNWFSAYHMLPIPTAGQISCIDQTGTVLMTWDMLGVTPVTWKGPNFDANQHNVATEQLTIHHQGFM